MCRYKSLNLMRSLRRPSRAPRIKDQKDLEAATGLVDTGHISSLPGASLERQTADGRFKRKMNDRIAMFICAHMCGPY